MYTCDITHPKTLDQSQSIDLIWAFDFHLVKGYMAHYDSMMICLYNVDQSWFVKGVIMAKIKHAG